MWDPVIDELPRHRAASYTFGPATGPTSAKN